MTDATPQTSFLSEPRARENLFMTWQDVKVSIQEELLSRGLSDPHIRLNALESLQRLLITRYPNLIQQPSLILSHPKVRIAESLAALKPNGKLNSAEKSVLNNVYQVVEGKDLKKSVRENHSPRPYKNRAARELSSQSDEHYVIDLCDEVLGSKALRQHRFDFLRGDARPGAQGVCLPVDAYYPEVDLVIEYRERQHNEAVSFFDKPDRVTVSGVHRGEQRRLYDERRRKGLPEHGIRLVELSHTDFRHDARKRLLRLETVDSRVVKSHLVGLYPKPPTKP